MADMTDMTPEQKREALKKCRILEIRAFVLPENEQDVAAALEAVIHRRGVFIVSNQALVTEEADIEEALENWCQVDQVIETLVDE